MESGKTNQFRSKSILYSILLALSLNVPSTSVVTSPADFGDTLRTAGSTLLEKIRGFDKSIVFDQLLNQVNKLGSQIGDIKDCILYSHGCTPQKRAAFYGTGIAILALTAAVVGFTITIAATAEEPDQDLENAAAHTQKEVKGLKPAAVLQRLTTRLALFKQNLISMKQCLVNRKCTKRQKRALYATAGTIAGIVIITLGIGIGSYIYAERKKKAEAAALPEEATTGVEEEATTGTKEVGGARPTIVFTFDKAAYQESQNPFQQLFRSIVPITEQGSAFLKNTYQTVKENVQAGLLKTKEAVSQAFITLLEKSKDFAALLKDILDVNITKVHEAFAQAKARLHILKSSLSDPATIELRNSFTFQAIDLARYIKQILDNVDLIKPLGATTKDALGKIASIAGKDRRLIVDTIRVREEEYRKRKLEKSAVQEAKNDLKIKDFINLDNLKEIYPTLHKKINALNLRQLGTVSEKIANGLASLIDIARIIHKQAGKLGLTISQDKIQQNLQSLETKIKELGQAIKEAFNVDKIIETEKVTTKELAKALIRAASSDKFEFLLTNWQQLKKVFNEFGIIDKKIDSIKLGIHKFKAYMENLQQNAKDRFITAIKTNPVKNIPHAAQILRESLATAAQETKNGLAKLIQSSSELFTRIYTIMPDTYALLNSLNGYMKQVSGNRIPLLNEKLLAGLNRIVEILKGTAESAEELNQAVQSESGG